MLLVLGFVLGALVVVLAQTFFVRPSPLPSGVSPNQSDLTILFTNQYMTRLVHDYAAQTSVPEVLRGVVVQAEPNDRLVLAGTANATVNGVKVNAPLRVVLHPTLNRNRVVVQVVQAQAGSLTLPPSLFEGIEGPINQQINQTLQNTPYEIVGINTTLEGLVVNVIVKK
ncbi:MAG TPA: hypothetical protein VFZ25_06185 [Chloroflexota bacterium]|nr:hypothetical protein [Chloroflexota bacterium]